MEEKEDLQEVKAESPQVEEKMLSQTQVNQIVQREKANATAKAKREAEQEYLRQLEMLKEGQKPETEEVVPRRTTAQPATDIDRDALYQEMQERFNQQMQQKQLEAEIQQVANTYLSKMADGKNNYQDFDSVTAEFDPSAFPQLVYLISGIDNAADVVYDLAKNPTKLVTLDALAQRAPKQAQAELNKLALSIKDNQQAQQEAAHQTVEAPLDRMQPGNIRSGNGKLSIRDLRTQPWLRG